MIVDSTIVPGGISFTNGHVESVKFRKNPVLQFFFKTRYNRNIKLSMMYKITQLWPLSPLLPPLCQISRLFLRIFCQKSRPYGQYISIKPYRVVLPWVIFHQRQELKFEKFCWTEVVLWHQYCSAYLNNQPQRKEIWYPVETGVIAVLKY